MTDRADLQDIQETLGGSGDAYARLVRRHQGQIAARMWRFAPDRLSLEELVQDVFVEAYLNLASYRGAGPFAHWLNRIATRVGYRHWKRRGQAAGTVSLQDWDGIASAEEPSLDAQEARQVLHDLLASLPPRDRLVLTLMYIEELPVAEVARQTGWSQVMVKVQAYRARKKLKELIRRSEIA